MQTTAELKIVVNCEENFAKISDNNAELGQYNNFKSHQMTEIPEKCFCHAIFRREDAHTTICLTVISVNFSFFVLSSKQPTGRQTDRPGHREVSIPFQ